MNEQIPTQAPIVNTPPPPTQPPIKPPNLLHQRIHPAIALLFIFAIAAAAVYCIWTKAHYNWAYDGIVTPSFTKEGDGGSSGDVAGWKTYRNEEYGYEIKYPANEYTLENLFNPGEKFNPQNIRVLNIDLAKKSIACSCGEFGSIAVLVEKNANNSTSAEEYLQTNFQTGFPINEPTVFAGLQARRFGTERSRSILVINGGYAYIIGEGDQPVDAQILYTFKFIEPTAQVDTSGWVNYRNESYAFEVKHDPDTYVEFKNDTLTIYGNGDSPGANIYLTKETKSEVIDRILNRIKAEIKGRLISTIEIDFEGEKATEIISEREENGCCGPNMVTVYDLVFMRNINSTTYHIQDHRDIAKGSFYIIKLIK